MARQRPERRQISVMLPRIVIELSEPYSDRQIMRSPDRTWIDRSLSDQIRILSSIFSSYGYRSHEYLILLDPGVMQHRYLQIPGQQAVCLHYF